VVADLLPVLDGIEAAKAHQEMTEGALMLADEVAKVAAKYGLTAFGEEGDPFDPHIHDALMHIDKPGYPVASVAQVFQRGYAIGDRVIRPARVGVADADETLAGAANPGAANPGAAETGEAGELRAWDVEDCVPDEASQPDAGI
jgi:molecular chaperone GrpE